MTAVPHEPLTLHLTPAPTGVPPAEAHPRRALSFKPLRSVLKEPYEDAFLIEDLLTTRMTFLTGEPKAGKSLFVAAMVRALLEGEPEFCGQKVLKPLCTVVYGFTDDGADAELRSRLDGCEAIEGVFVEPMFAASDDRWRDVTARLLDERPGLFVLDTMLGALTEGEDIASGPVAQRTVARLRPISEAGIPVLVVTHTPKANTEGLSVASSVMGGRALAAGVRGVIALRKDKRDGRRINTSINRARVDLNVPVTVSPRWPGSEVPAWRVRPSGGKKATRPDWRDAFVEAVVAEQPTCSSNSGLAKHVGTRFGVGESSLRKCASERLLHDGVRWVHVGETETDLAAA